MTDHFENDKGKWWTFKRNVSGFFYLRTGHESDYEVSGGINYVYPALTRSWP